MAVAAEYMSGLAEFEVVELLSQKVNRYLYMYSF